MKTTISKKCKMFPNNNHEQGITPPAPAAAPAPPRSTAQRLAPPAWSSGSTAEPFSGTSPRSASSSSAAKGSSRKDRSVWRQKGRTTGAGGGLFLGGFFCHVFFLSFLPKWCSVFCSAKVKVVCCLEKPLFCNIEIGVGAETSSPQKKRQRENNPRNTRGAWQSQRCPGSFRFGDENPSKFKLASAWFMDVCHTSCFPLLAKGSGNM